jgi:hypothetical protein
MIKSRAKMPDLVKSLFVQIKKEVGIKW